MFLHFLLLVSARKVKIQLRAYSMFGLGFFFFVVCLFLNFSFLFVYLFFNLLLKSYFLSAGKGDQIWWSNYYIIHTSVQWIHETKSGYLNLTT